MIKYGKLLVGAGIAGGLVLALGGAVRADIIPVLQTPITTLGPNNFRFDYTVSLTDSQQMIQGQPVFFTIYDFAGYIPNSAVAPNANWSVAVANTTPPPAGISLVNPDNTGLPDLKFTYTGPTLTGPFTLGTFSARSTFNQLTTDEYAATAQKFTTTADNGVQTSNRGPNIVPLATAIPEPGTMALLGSGLLSLGALGGLRRRRIA